MVDENNSYENDSTVVDSTSSCSDDSSSSTSDVNCNSTVEGTGVQITALHPWDGNSLEYLKITNFGNYTVDLTGWKLKNECGETFTFSNVTINSGATLTVYTTEGKNSEETYYLNLSHHMWNKKGTAKLIYESDFTN